MSKEFLEEQLESLKSSFKDILKDLNLELKEMFDFYNKLREIPELEMIYTVPRKLRKGPFTKKIYISIKDKEMKLSDRNNRIICFINEDHIQFSYDCINCKIHKVEDVFDVDNVNSYIQFEVIYNLVKELSKVPNFLSDAQDYYKDDLLTEVKRRKKLIKSILPKTKKKEKVCNCGNKLSKETIFCPKCGSKYNSIMDKICKSTGLSKDEVWSDHPIKMYNKHQNIIPRDHSMSSNDNINKSCNTCVWEYNCRESPETCYRYYESKKKDIFKRTKPLNERYGNISGFLKDYLIGFNNMESLEYSREYSIFYNELMKYPNFLKYLKENPINPYYNTLEKWIDSEYENRSCAICDSKEKCSLLQNIYKDSTDSKYTMRCDKFTKKEDKTLHSYQEYVKSLGDKWDLMTKESWDKQKLNIENCSMCKHYNEDGTCLYLEYDIPNKGRHRYMDVCRRYEKNR